MTTMTTEEKQTEAPINNLIHWVRSSLAESLVKD